MLSAGAAVLSADPYVLGGDSSEGTLEFLVAQRMPQDATGGSLKLPGGEPAPAEVVRLGGSALALARASAPVQDPDRASDEWAELMRSMDGFSWEYAGD